MGQCRSTARRHIDSNSYDSSKYLSTPIAWSRAGFWPTPLPMPSEDERATVFQCGDFDESALCRLASKLRGGYSCFCDTAQIPACGSFNWTIQISFDDGVQWVLRSPRTDGAIRSKETNLLLLANEAATLKYIRANSTVPVPQIFSYR